MTVSWFLVLIGPLFLAVRGFMAPAALVPLVGLLGLVGAVRREARWRAWFEELRVLAVVGLNLLAVAAALDLADASQPPQGVVFAALFFVCGVGVMGVASEFSRATVDQWLLAPRSLRRLLAERQAPAVVVSACALAMVALSGPQVAKADAFLPAVAVTLGGLPVVVSLLTREPLRAWLVVFMVSSLFVQRPAWAPFMVAASVGSWLLVLVRPRELMHVQPRSVGWTVGARPRSGAWRALVWKELMLQRFSLVLAPVVLVAIALSPRDQATAVAFFSGLLVAGVAGLTSVLEERALRTQWADAMVVTTRDAWRVKMLVTFAAAVVAGVVLPCAVLSVHPGFGSGVEQLHWTTWLGLDVLGFLGVVCVATAMGVVCATLARDLVWAVTGLFGIAALTLITFVLVAMQGTNAASGLLQSGWVRPSVFDAQVGPMVAFVVTRVPEWVMVVTFVVLGRKAWLTGVLPRAAWLKGAAAVIISMYVGALLRSMVLTA